jgi:60 kDa SS-A/Ro ribonucleoprotein
MSIYSNFRKGTPQTEALPGQSRNNAGGFSYTISKWERLERFLIMGSEGGTYYVGEQKLTRDSATCIEECLAEDYRRTLNTIKDISVAGRAPKTQPAIFALALACTHEDEEVRRNAYLYIPHVCRIGTHLFTLLNYVTNLKGGRSGSGFQRAIARWYIDKPVDQVAYQTIKYRNREGWTHRDALRIAHPKVAEGDKARKHLFNFVCDRADDKKIAKHESLRKVEGFRKMQDAKTAQEAAKLITQYELPWETVPTEFHNHAIVWEAIYDIGQLGQTALIRQLPRLTNLGVINTRPIAETITNGDLLTKSRVHPMFVLNALYTYKAGTGRGTTTWQPARKIVDALDHAFYKSFGNVEPTGKRINIGIDVSGSMRWRAIPNTNINCAQAAAAMALVTANVEHDYEIRGFSHEYVNLPISPRQRMDDVLREMEMPFGRTDCSLPMMWALEEGREFDAFCIYTDNETYAGRQHPSEALKMYRKKTGIDAKLIVVGMTATQFTIADPNDTGSLDVVGFDTATPDLISQFIAG